MPQLYMKITTPMNQAKDLAYRHTVVSNLVGFERDLKAEAEFVGIDDDNGFMYRFSDGSRIVCYGLHSIRVLDKEEK